MKTLDTEHLERLMQSSEHYTLINVLGEDAFEENHIPGSVNIPVGKDGFVEAVADEVDDNNARIVVYCADEDCPASEQAAQKLEAAGYTNVYDYTGGMAAWRKEGKPVESQ